jgi:hypothetical protein
MFDLNLLVSRGWVQLDSTWEAANASRTLRDEAQAAGYTVTREKNVGGWRVEVVEQPFDAAEFERLLALNVAKA